MIYRLAILLFPCFLLAQTGNLAPPPFTSMPPIEDRNLYYGFLTYEQIVFSANQAAEAANPSLATQIDTQTATTLGIKVQELATVISIVQRANLDYQQIPSLRQAYVSSPSSVSLSSAQLDGIDDFRKLASTAQAVLKLSQQLSASSWAGLHNYIITTFKNSLKQPK